MWSWIERLIAVKMSIIPKVIYKFSAIYIKIPKFLAEEASILKLIRNLKGNQVAKIVLKKNKGGILTIPDFKTYYKAIQ